MRNEPEFSIQTQQYDLSFPEYYDVTKTFGDFNEDGSYTVTDRNTPRPWLSIMCNENIFSAISNEGKGFLAYRYGKLRMTKHYVESDYLLRTPNGTRQYLIKDGEKTYDLLKEAEDLRFTVWPGRTRFTGRVGEISFQIDIFVPVEDGVECVRVRLCGGAKHRYQLCTGTEWTFADHRRKVNEGRFPADLTIDFAEDLVLLHSDEVRSCPDMYGFMAQKGVTGRIEKREELLSNGKDTYKINYVFTEKTLCTDSEGHAEDYIFFGLVQGDYRSLVEKYLYGDGYEKEYAALCAYWDEVIHRNYVTLPDKNMEVLLNVWLKNQVHVTSLYNRFGYMGYRDILQDCWGVGFVDWKRTRHHILLAAAHMFADGRCPRQFDIVDIGHLDRRDFCDSPMWMPIALNSYIKETGDFDILKEEIGFFESEERSTLEDHIFRAFDYLYNNRATNGLILMRGGDWLDGLEGINKLGEATSVWGTCATVYAQKQLMEIYEQLGRKDLVDTFAKRNAEYTEAANTKGFNGKWYSYATINDTEVIGHPDNLEGKIYLNPNTWAIFSGVADKDKTESAMRWVRLYLNTPYGPQLNWPPYVATGEGYGRLKRQRPGTFANSAIYMHAASFKVFADIARGDFIEAYDTFTRLLPGHVDNPHARRTSEPWSVGNVYFGINHKNPGLNLYSWFSATPAWLLHGGFEEILGVWPTYHGIRVRACDLPEWDGYKVSKVYRGTRYNVTFRRTGAKTITLDGKPVDGDIVYSENPTAEVIVEY